MTKRIAFDVLATMTLAIFLGCERNPPTEASAVRGAGSAPTVALNVVRIFEIADREVRAWMNAFLKPLELRVAAFHEHQNSVAATDEVPLQFDQFDLQHVQLGLVVLARDGGCRRARP